MADAWHSKETEQVLNELKVDQQGLSSEEAKRRLDEFGYNELKEKKKVTPFQIFLRQFKDVFVLMLIAATVISFLIGETVDAVTIAVIVILNSVVGFVQEYRSEKAMEAMKKLTAPKARVMRNGDETVVDAREIVPGDIVFLEAGDRVPADGRLIETVDLKADEAVLTGESTDVTKGVSAVKEDTPIADRKNSVFMATHMTYGRGKAVITATGMKTEFGKIAELVQTMETEESPLKQKLERFAKKLGIVIVALTAVIFALELYEIFILGVVEPGGIISSVLDAFEVSIALAVSAVPEGLPAIVTVSLALGARELAKRNAILRKLTSAETLGATTVICSDKTGTLTKGEMTVRKIHVNGKMFDVTGAGYEPKGEFLVDDKAVSPQKNPELELLLRANTLNANAHYDGKRVIGDTTEGALIVAATKAGIAKKDAEEMYPRVHEVPFTSERKRMTTVHKTPEGKLVAYVKGAPEMILERSTRILKDEKVKKLTVEDKEKILAINEQMAKDALRVLGVAYKNVPADAVEKFDEEDYESDLVFLGLSGMIDPPRPEAKEANARCRQAGIKTVMITGDHKLTAVAIAKELGMLHSDKVLIGVELDDLNDTEFEKVVEEVSVYARVSPEHKLRIVKALKKKGEIVAKRFLCLMKTPECQSVLCQGSMRGYRACLHRC